MQIEEQVRHHPRIQLEEGRKESPARKSLHCEGQIKPGKLRKMFVFQQATSQDLAVSTTQAKNWLSRKIVIEGKDLLCFQPRPLKMTVHKTTYLMAECTCQESSTQEWNCFENYKLMCLVWTVLTICSVGTKFGKIQFISHLPDICCCGRPTN